MTQLKNGNSNSGKFWTIAGVVGALGVSLLSSVIALYVSVGTLYSKMDEIETQFCEMDSIHNLMHAYDMRMQAVLFDKLFPDSKWPTDNSYYPSIGKCHDSSVMPK
jgi:hypothetical protein